MPAALTGSKRTRWAADMIHYAPWDIKYPSSRRQNSSGNDTRGSGGSAFRKGGVRGANLQFDARAPTQRGFSNGEVAA